MKRLISALLTAVLLFTLIAMLVACGEPTPEATKSYTVTFDSAGGTPVAAQTVESGKKATEPTPPTREGYVFNGWYHGSEKWSFIGYVVTEDITLNARWEKSGVDAAKSYTVTFDSAGGSEVAPQAVEAGCKATEPTPPEKDGHTFLGWYVGSERWSFLNCTVTADITLTAKWEENKGTAPEPFDPTKRTTITFYYPLGTKYGQVINAAINEFKIKYPNITVIASSQYMNDLYYTIEYEGRPDLTFGYANQLCDYITSNDIQNLDFFINDEAYGFTDAELGNFVSGVINDNDNYFVPIANATEVLYYNKSFFEEHSLTVPTTWDEMEETMKRIKEIDPGCIPLGYDSESNLFITMAAQSNSSYTDATANNPFTFDNETNRAFAERLRTWYQNRWITTQQLSGGYTSSLFSGESDSGTRCYMCISSTAGAIYNQPKQTNGVYSFQVGIAAIPQLDKANPKIISQGYSLCVFQNEDSQKTWASWLFLKHLATSEEFQASFAIDIGYTPIIRSVVNLPSYAAFLAGADEDGTKNIQAYALKVALEQAGAYFVPDIFHGADVAREVVGLLMQRCLAYSGTDATAAIKSMFEEAVTECKRLAGIPIA